MAAAVSVLMSSGVAHPPLLAAVPRLRANAPGHANTRPDTQARVRAGASLHAYQQCAAVGHVPWPARAAVFAMLLSIAAL